MAGHGRHHIFHPSSPVSIYTTARPGHVCSRSKETARNTKVDRWPRSSYLESNRYLPVTLNFPAYVITTDPLSEPAPQKLYDNRRLSPLRTWPTGSKCPICPFVASAPGPHPYQADSLYSTVISHATLAFVCLTLCSRQRCNPFTTLPVLCIASTPLPHLQHLPEQLLFPFLQPACP